jgi:hypothetical protein
MKNVLNEREIELREVEYWRRIDEYDSKALSAGKVERVLRAVFWRLVDGQVNKVDLVATANLLYLTFEGGQIMLNDVSHPRRPFPFADELRSYAVLRFIELEGAMDVQDALDGYVLESEELYVLM